MQHTKTKESETILQTNYSTKQDEGDEMIPSGRNINASMENDNEEEVEIPCFDIPVRA